jgi:hypothetical protein
MWRTEYRRSDNAGFPPNQSAGLRLEAETTQEINNLKSKRESNAAIRADKQRQLVLFCVC